MAVRNLLYINAPLTGNEMDQLLPWWWYWWYNRTYKKWLLELLVARVNDWTRNDAILVNLGRPTEPILLTVFALDLDIKPWDMLATSNSSLLEPLQPDIHSEHTLSGSSKIVPIAPVVFEFLDILWADQKFSHPGSDFKVMFESWVFNSVFGQGYLFMDRDK